MPGFRSIPDTPLEKGLEKARLEATRLDERYADLLERELEKLGRKVLPASADPLDIGVDGMIGRAMEHRGSLDKLLERMMLEAAVLGAQEGNASLNQMLAGAKAVITIGAAWDLANQTVEDWIRTQHWFSPLSLTQGLTNTERNRIRTLMVDFVTNQRPQAWLRDQIVGDTGLYGRRRAETIARTEVTHAFARGNRAAWAGRGVERVSWRTRVDELVCPICGPLHMQEFDVGSDVIPPAHARCRCWIVPAVDRDSIPELPEPEVLPTSGKPGSYLLPDAVSDRNAASILQRMRDEGISKAAAKKYVNQKSAQYGKTIGVGKADVREEIMTPWAYSSNDTELRSLTMQKRSETLFGTKMSAWQEEELRKTAEASAKLNMPSIAQFRRPFQLVAETPEKAMELTDDALRAIYADTQAMLAEEGIENVTVYRGFFTKPGEVFSSGEVVDIGWVNALESWTVDPVVAYNYAYEQGVIVAASVPAKRIFATSLQGMGEFKEREVVVMGSMLGRASEAVKVVKSTGEVWK